MKAEPGACPQPCSVVGRQGLGYLERALFRPDSRKVSLGTNQGSSTSGVHNSIERDAKEILQLLALGGWSSHSQVGRDIYDSHHELCFSYTQEDCVSFMVCG